ncbi:MAG: hypothetical protein ABH857_03045 [Elusimicrobiota bacterium]
MSASLFILVNETQNRRGVDPDSILSYQIGRFKRLFSRIFLIVDGRNKYPYLGVPVFSNKYKSSKNLGKLLTGLLHVRTHANMFLDCNDLSMDEKKIEKFLGALGEYMAVLPLKNNMVSFAYGVISKKSLNDLKGLLSKRNHTESEILDLINTNYINE